MATFYEGVKSRILNVTQISLAENDVNSTDCTFTLLVINITVLCEVRNFVNASKHNRYYLIYTAEHYVHNTIT
jgi:hypothetical protein